MLSIVTSSLISIRGIVSRDSKLINCVYFCSISRLHRGATISP